MIEILSTDQVMEQYNLVKGFVIVHAKEMGGRGRPRRFDRVLVEQFLSDYFREKLRIEREKDERAAALAETMKESIEEARARHRGNPENVRPIRGKKVAA